MRRYVQASIWRYLRDHPYSKRSEIAEGLGQPNKRIADVLRRMHPTGIVTMHGVNPNQRWTANGDQEPQDMWGLHPASQASLTANTNAQRGTVKVPSNRKPGRYRPKPLPAPATELDRCWPYRPQQQEDRT